jgi:hypothetical protein
VSLPEATSIGSYAFSVCTTLTTVELPKATSIGDYAFIGCTALTTASLPEATSIGDYAFYGCALATVSFPEATSIGDQAFASCTALATVSLPEATSIGNSAFRSTGTTKALTITLGTTVPTLGIRMFDNVSGGPKSVTVKVPNNATWSGIIGGSFTGTENTTGGPHWGEGSRGRGWTSDGAYVNGGTVNSSITLTIEALP